MCKRRCSVCCCCCPVSIWVTSMDMYPVKRGGLSDSSESSLVRFDQNNLKNTTETSQEKLKKQKRPPPLFPPKSPKDFPHTAGPTAPTCLLETNQNLVSNSPSCFRMVKSTLMTQQKLTDTYVAENLMNEWLLLLLLLPPPPPPPPPPLLLDPRWFVAAGAELGQPTDAAA